MKAKFKCNDCKLKICGPCEIAHIKTKVTRHHTIEPLHQLNLLQYSLPGFAKPSVGGTVSSSAEKSSTWVDNLERDENEESVTLDHLDNPFDLLGKFYSESSELK